MNQMRSRVARRFVACLLTLSAVLLTVRWGGIAADQTSNLVVSSVSVTGSSLTLSGSGGLAGAIYYVLASTNIALSPRSLWDGISTNTFAADGTFTNSVSIDPTFQQEFFVIATSFVIPDTNAPSAPGSLTATAVSSNQINLSWLSSTDNVAVTGYLVERQDPGSANFAQIGTTAVTNYDDTGLTANTNYSYRVRATDAAANLSPYSGVASATTFPGVAAAFTASPTNGAWPLVVTFTDTSSGAVTNRFWDFGDNVTSNTMATSVLHTYSVAGTNTVSLTVSGPSGADSQTRTNYVVVVNPAHLAVTPGSLNYGSVTIGQTGSLSFSVFNTGDLPLSGTASSAAPFSVTSGGGYSLAGGQTQVVTVAFAPGSAGTFNGSVIFASDGGTSTNAVSGVGLTAGSISVSPLTYDFGTLVTGTTAQTSFTIINSGGTAVSNGTATVGAPFSIVSGATFSVPGFGTTNVAVRFAPVSSGSFSNSVVFATANGGNATSTVTGAGAMVPVAAYSFDEGTGTTVADASGHGNNGTIGAATWTNAGRYGNALVFNGTSARVTINDSTSLHLTTGMTLEAWVNPSTMSSAWRDVIYKGNDNYYLEATSDHSGVPGGGGTFGAADVVTFGASDLVGTKWTHLAMTYDSATLRLYVNGVQMSSLTQTGNILVSANSLQIGGDSIFGQYFSGMIDEVRVYNVALTAAQIQADMNRPVGNILTVPGNLTATAVSSNQINLSWTASRGGLGAAYLVERQGPDNTNFVQIGLAPGTTYNDTSLTADTTYSYRVSATNAVGYVSPYSNVAQAYTGFSVSPRATVLTFTRTQQFSFNLGGTNVVWSVDGVAGGSAPAGTITTGGLYSPPGSIGSHTVTASTSDPTRSTTATVYVSNYPGTLTFHNDNFRTGQNLGETVLNPTNVNSGTVGKLFGYALDGLTFASPLYVANVNIPSKGFHNVVFVATEHDSVYAFDADGLTNGPLWQTSFINPAAGVTTVPAVDTLEIGDIPGEIGITGTPVIDSTNGTLYVVAKTKEVSGNTTSYVQRLHALDITTGAEKLGGPVVIQGSVSGTGMGSQGGVLAFDSLRENQRTGLLLANGVLYFGFSSHGDHEPFHGWLMGYSATTLQQVLIYCATPNGDDGGIWMNGDGAAVDAAGNIYFITGDGLMDANTGGTDYGDCFEKISPAGAVLDYFSPSVQSSLDVSNLDLGSGGVLLLPDQSGAHPHEMVSAGKNGTIYLVDRDNMGHYHTNSDQIVQSVVNIFRTVTGQEGGNFSSPVYFNGSVYFSPVEDNVQAFQLSNGLLPTSPTSQSAGTYGGRGGTMAISANGSADGILWALESTGSASPGVLHAYDAGNLGNELYNSSQAGSRDTLDVWSKFSLPLVANGKVFISSVGQLTVYGLLP